MTPIKASVEILTVTPKLANEWLADKWGEQRGIRKARVSMYANDMTEGKFMLSPDAILRIKGKLANGQHRLTAVVQSGKPQTFLVLSSNDENLYKVIDAGLRRQVRDALFGTPYAANLAPIARWVRGYELGGITAGARDANETSRTGDKVNASQVEIIDYCKEHQELLAEAATFVHGAYSTTRIMAQSLAGALYVIATNAGKNVEGKEFILTVYIGGKGDTIADDFRNRLITDKSSQAKLPGGYILGLAIKAFDYYLRGLRPKLSWKAGDPLPKIGGRP